MRSSTVIIILGPTDPSQLLQYIERLVDGKYSCMLCNAYSHVNKSCTKNHIEAKHFPNTFIYKCNICYKTFYNRIAMNNHRAREHK